MLNEQKLLKSWLENQLAVFEKQITGNTEVIYLLNFLIGAL